METTKALVENSYYFYPNEYSGSYSLLFSSYDFNFSVLEKFNKENKVGRPRYDRNSFFKFYLLRVLFLPNNYRSVHGRLKIDKDLAKIIGFDPDRIPGISTLKSFLYELTIDELYEINSQLIWELYELGGLKLDKLAIDSFPIESYFIPPTKNQKKVQDPDATWGFSKKMNGWF